MNLKMKFQPRNSETGRPAYQSEGASGFDLHADVSMLVDIEPGQTEIIATGISVEVPTGYELQVRPRSGLAAKNGITVLNTPGTVDSDYRGEIKVILHNTSGKTYQVQPNDRIAQAVICPVIQPNIVFVDDLSNTERGDGHFGSTGK